jgi:uncharacterized membrane protein
VPVVSSQSPARTTADAASGSSAAGSLPDRRGWFADRPAVAAWCLALLACLIFSGVAIRQHDTFHTRARDMGIYAQVVWNTAHGRPFTSTLLQDNRLHVAEHVAPLLALIAPLYAIVPDPRLLLVLQQLALAGAGLPIFFWARLRIGDLAALALLAGYYLMPATSRIAFSEFHPIVFAALPVSLGIWAVLEGRTRAAAVWLLLALLVDDETAPIVGAAGAYLWLFGGDRRKTPPPNPLPIAMERGRWVTAPLSVATGRGWGWGLPGFGLGVLAAAWLLATTLLIMPAFHDPKTLDRVGTTRLLDHFQPVRDNPAIVLGWLLGDRGTHAASWLLLPTLGLPLLAPQVLAIALPAFAVLFLADREGNVAGHWAGAVLPVYWFAAAAGLATLQRLVGRQGLARRRLVTRIVVAGLAVVMAGCFLEYSYFPGGAEHDDDWLSWTEQEENLATAVSLVPPAARVDATRRIVPHLAHRPEVYQFPSTLYSAPMRPDLSKIDVFLFDLTDSQTARALDATDQDTVLTRRPRFNVWTWGESVLLLSKDRPTPPRPLDLTFGGALRLAGYDVEQRPGRVRLTAYWETIGKAGAWVRRAELVGPDGTVVASIEGAPLDPYLPPSKWDRGQSIVEALDLRPPPGLPGGQYRLRLAWHDQNGAPIPSERGESAEVTTVTLP